MISPEDGQKIVKFGTVVKMFQAFADLMQEEKIVNDQGLVYSVTRGRYTNSSIVKWLDAHADGLVYGVQIPKYSYSTTTEATKTDANADLVLEPSSATVTGRNDYEGRKLFWCVRVNGGVDANGMPYITAIEGQDDRFDCKAADTWALTPVYYVKRTETDEYTWNQFSDTQLEGFEPCHGAFTLDGAARPYILRACYVSSDGEISSRSGETPSSWINDPASGSRANVSLAFAHNLVNAREDGITALSHGDMTYLIEFMQLMLGVKSPKSAASGFLGVGVTSWYSGAKIRKITTGKSFAISASEASLFKVGRSVWVKSPFDEIIVDSRRIVAVEEDGNLTWVHLDVDEDFDTMSTNSTAGVTSSRNGACDEVLGTFGTSNLDLLNTGESLFRFQNIECVTGRSEVIYDLNFVNGKLCVPSEPGSPYDRKKWNPLGDQPEAGYVADLVCIDGVLVKTSEAATADTGYMVKWNINGPNEALLACYCNKDEGGVGSVDGEDVYSSPVFRMSAIGLSSRPDAQA